MHLKPAYALHAYVFRDGGGNGNGVVYAMPIDAAFPEPEQCPTDSSRFLEPPVPPSALPNLMMAIEGDGSPASYLQASLFARELLKFGASWHGCDWSTHKIIGKDPRRDGGNAVWISKPAKWKWTSDAVENWIGWRNRCSARYKEARQAAWVESHRRP